MKITNNGYIIDADDEEPDCMMCCHATMYSDDYCCDFCGASHGWAEYERFESFDKNSN